MTPAEIIKDQLPKRVAELKALGYCVEAFEKAGQINVYLSGKVISYYVTTGTLCFRNRTFNKGVSFTEFLEFLKDNE